MKIMITGAGGFVGKSIIEQLENKYQFIPLTRHQLDLTDYKKVAKIIKKNQVNVIIDCSASAGKNDLSHTFIFFLSLLSNINYFDKLIYFGSGADLDKNRDLIKIKETDWGKHIPFDDYGLAKYTIQQIVNKQKKIISLRIFGLYGQYEDYTRKFISNAVIKNLLGLPIVIKQNVIFDYLFIDDLIKIVDHCLNHRCKYNNYNVTPNQSIDLVTIAKIINSLSIKKSKIIVSNPGLNYQYTGDNSRIKKEIPDLIFTPYKKGIGQVYKYFAKNIDKIDKQLIIQDKFYIKSHIRK